MCSMTGVAGSEASNIAQLYLRMFFIVSVFPPPPGSPEWGGAWTVVSLQNLWFWAGSADPEVLNLFVLRNRF